MDKKLQEIIEAALDAEYARGYRACLNASGGVVGGKNIYAASTVPKNGTTVTVITRNDIHWQEYAKKEAIRFGASGRWVVGTGGYPTKFNGEILGWYQEK